MAFFNKEQYFRDFPDLKDVYNRINESEIETKRLQTESEKSENKRHRKLYPDHFCITQYYTNGIWRERMCSRKSGGTAFIAELKSVIDSRNPDAIKVEVYKGSGERSAPVFKTNIALKESAALGNLEESENDNKFQRLESMAERLSGNNGGSSEAQKLIQDLKDQINEQKHSHEIEKLTARYESKIEKLQDQLEDKELEIRELEDEIADGESALGSIQKAIETVQNPRGVQYGINVISGVCENLIPHLERFINPNKQKLLSPTPSTDTSDFSVASSFSALSPDHEEGIAILNKIFRQATVHEFAKMYSIVLQFQDTSTQAFDSALADKIIEFIKTTKNERENSI